MKSSGFWKCTKSAPKVHQKCTKSAPPFHHFFTTFVYTKQHKLQNCTKLSPELHHNCTTTSPTMHHNFITCSPHCSLTLLNWLPTFTTELTLWVNSHINSIDFQEIPGFTWVTLHTYKSHSYTSKLATISTLLVKLTAPTLHHHVPHTYTYWYNCLHVNCYMCKTTQVTVCVFMYHHSCTYLTRCHACWIVTC